MTDLQRHVEDKIFGHNENEICHTCHSKDEWREGKNGSSLQAQIYKYKIVIFNN